LRIVTGCSARTVSRAARLLVDRIGGRLAPAVRLPVAPELIVRQHGTARALK
jgi:DNA-binding LacI/PurR family transcriptional regulator